MQTARLVILDEVSLFNYTRPTWLVAVAFFFNIIEQGLSRIGKCNAFLSWKADIFCKTEKKQQLIITSNGEKGNCQNLCKKKKEEEASRQD